MISTRRFIPAFLTVCTAMAVAEDNNPPWSYSGDTGPQHWAALGPDRAQRARMQHSQSYHTPLNLPNLSDQILISTDEAGPSASLLFR